MCSESLSDSKHNYGQFLLEMVEAYSQRHLNWYKRNPRSSDLSDLQCQHSRCQICRFLISELLTPKTTCVSGEQM